MHRRNRDDIQHADIVDIHAGDDLHVTFREPVVYREVVADPVSIQHHDGPTFTNTQVSPTGDATFGMQGETPKNESGNKQLCIILAESMSREDGDSWTADPEPPTGPERGVDWTIRASNRAIDVQVTRVNPQHWWAELGRTGSMGGYSSCAESAEEIWAAISRKCLAQDEQVILALDARYPGFHRSGQVVEEFKRRHGYELQKLRFAQVWLVGFNVDLTCCLHRSIRQAI